MKTKYKNRSYSVWNGQIWQVLDFFENGNETSQLEIKCFSEEALVSQDAVNFLKHPVLRNVCHYNFVHSFVTATFVSYMNDLLFHFLFLNISSSLIDFIFFTRQ